LFKLFTVISQNYRQLRPDDSFGLVLFNHAARVVQPLKQWKDIDSVDLEKQIMKFRADGGTDISAAVSEATKMFTKKETERYTYFFPLPFIQIINLTLFTERDILTEFSS
jgi:hypothetical protein